MPSTMTVKPKPADASRKSKALRQTAESCGAGGERQAAAVRKTRASSCSRSQRGPSTSTGAQGPKPCCQTRTRSTSAAPKATGTKAAERSTRTESERRRAASSVRQADVNLKPREITGCPGEKEPRVSRAEGKVVIQSHKAFTVIPPNPKKRREIQKKAEAELAALEELRLSRAMGYVSINPSSVGGCLSLEEVRLKQQREMMQARRKQKQVRKQVMEETPVLTR